MRGARLMCTSLALVLAGCAGLAPLATVSPSAQPPAASAVLVGHPDPAETAVPRGRATPATEVPPAVELRAIARRKHATFVAGPKDGPAGLFAAFSVVRSASAVGNPHNKLRLLRWNGKHWIADGSLLAERREAFWDYPNYSLDAALVDGASTEAPVFFGTVNGAGNTAVMVAVRINGAWRWSTFLGCQLPAWCPQVTTRGDVILNPHVVSGRFVGTVGNCQPDCGDSRAVFANYWSWSAHRRLFALVGRGQIAERRMRQRMTQASPR
jgi:hypothetical protein